MGVFTKRVLYADLQRRTTAEVDTVIDTGSHYCAVPESVAVLLGLQPVGMEQVVLADGRESEFPVAGLRVELEGRVVFINTLILPDPAEPVLGAQALSTFRVGVEPTGEKLIPEVIRLFTMTGWPFDKPRANG